MTVHAPDQGRPGDAAQDPGRDGPAGLRQALRRALRRALQPDRRAGDGRPLRRLSPCPTARRARTTSSSRSTPCATASSSGARTAARRHERGGLARSSACRTGCSGRARGGVDVMTHLARRGDYGPTDDPDGLARELSDRFASGAVTSLTRRLPDGRHLRADARPCRRRAACRHLSGSATSRWSVTKRRRRSRDSHRGAFHDVLPVARSASSATASVAAGARPGGAARAASQRHHGDAALADDPAISARRHPEAARGHPAAQRRAHPGDAGELAGAQPHRPRAPARPARRPDRPRRHRAADRRGRRAAPRHHRPRRPAPPRTSRAAASPTR